MKNWKAVIRTMAPTLGAALGGPIGGMATKALSEGLLGKPDATDRELSEVVLNANPQSLAQIKQIENNFELEMKKLQVNVFEIEAESQENARKIHGNNTFVPFLTIVLTILVGAGAYSFITYQIPAENQNILYMVFGSIMTSWTTAMGYWFGTTKSSSRKNELLARK